jgi:plasmid stability protein
MPTLTIRNLPEDVHDALRREAAEHRRSMEEEARRALTERFRRRRSQEEIDAMLASLEATMQPLPADAKMLVSESLIADRRMEVLFEEGLISLEEKREWDDRITRLAVSLSEVETFFDSKWPHKKP